MLHLNSLKFNVRYRNPISQKYIAKFRDRSHKKLKNQMIVATNGKIENDKKQISQDKECRCPQLILNLNASSVSWKTSPFFFFHTKY